MNLNDMQINRQSYEEYFLLYADGELNDAEKKAVEEFVFENPDLADEFAVVHQTIMHPDESIIFEHKELLYRSEGNDKKIMYMRWFRISAAAVLMIALSLVGWLFVDRREMHVQPVAMKQRPVKTTETGTKNRTENKSSQNKNTDNINSNNQNDNSSSRETNSSENKRAQQSTSAGAQRISTGVRNANSEKQTINEPDNENIDESSHEPGVTLQKESPVGDVATPDVALSPIDVPVQPHALQQPNEEQPSEASYAKASYNDEPEKNDMIYFANTSLTKKTKLREIFRKTTRYIDRVTSLQ